MSINPARDFAVFIRSTSSAEINFHSASIAANTWWKFPTGVETCYSNGTKEITAELCVYSKGVVTVLEEYLTTAEDITLSGDPIFEHFYLFPIPGVDTWTGDVICTYSGGYQYIQENLFASETDSSINPLLSPDSGGIYFDYNSLTYNYGWDDGWSNIPIAAGSSPALAWSIFGVEFRNKTMATAPIFTECTASDDGRTIWMVLRCLTTYGTFWHRLLIRDGVVTRDAEEVLDAATGFTWNQATWRYFPLT